ncbi:hypothetical protein B0919_08125 [Hymenobacter sp. CRA2]|nr:hypothetical protein B0919_08125 [Hymenobacter sp. CRA2]
MLPVVAGAHHRHTPPDSIGVVVQQDKTYVRHRVVAGETLYGLARRYKVSVEQIMAANPSIKGALVSGQIVLVPRVRAVLPAGTGASNAAPKAAAAAPAATKGLAIDAAGNKVYKVQPGQTLFAISRKFGVAPATLQRYNRLPADGGVRVGQTLIIVPAAGGNAAEPVAAAPKPAPPTARPERDDEAEKETKQREAEREKEREAAKTKDAETAKEPASSPVAATATAEEDTGPTRASEVMRKVKESGVAAVIEGGRSDKYLALHKTAQVGTIIRVLNIMNGRDVYVRVIGKLPDTGDNANVLIRLSRNAATMLGTPDQRFRVETSYLSE